MEANRKIPQSQTVTLEIDLKKLARLMDSGHLCAADIHCVNCESRNQVKELCLRLCANNLHR